MMQPELRPWQWERRGQTGEMSGRQNHQDQKIDGIWEKGGEKTDVFRIFTLALWMKSDAVYNDVENSRMNR